MGTAVPDDIDEEEGVGTPSAPSPRSRRMMYSVTRSVWMVVEDDGALPFRDAVE